MWRQISRGNYAWIPDRHPRCIWGLPMLSYEGPNRSAHGLSSMTCRPPSSFLSKDTSFPDPPRKYRLYLPRNQTHAVPRCVPRTCIHPSLGLVESARTLWRNWLRVQILAGSDTYTLLFPCGTPCPMTSQVQNWQWNVSRLDWKLTCFVKHMHSNDHSACDLVEERLTTLPTFTITYSYMFIESTIIRAPSGFSLGTYDMIQKFLLKKSDVRELILGHVL